MSRIKRISTFILCIVLLAGISSLFVACRKDNGTESPSISEEATEHFETVDVPEEYTVEAPDADSYYEQNSKIVTVIDAQDSDEVLTEAETYTTLTDRGFTQFPVTSSYSMGGEYYDAEDVNNVGTDKHPIYETYYITNSDDIWSVFMINGVTMAYPASYNLQSNLGVQVIVSESETIMSYDSTTNKFYETIPNKSVLLVVTVEKIDVALLELLTIEEIDGHVK
ncbi:MAG: hypothetical protein E7564_07775 [Ruminococcaceae bacterium]|nr:hypothetical protein [Oscillospiraceae bacterium]